MNHWWSIEKLKMTPKTVVMLNVTGIVLRWKWVKKITCLFVFTVSGTKAAWALFGVIVWNKGVLYAAVKEKQQVKDLQADYQCGIQLRTKS